MDLNEAMTKLAQAQSQTTASQASVERVERARDVLGRFVKVKK